MKRKDFGIPHLLNLSKAIRRGKWVSQPVLGAWNIFKLPVLPSTYKFFHSERQEKKEKKKRKKREETIGGSAGV